MTGESTTYVRVARSEETIRVSSRTNVKDLAWAITKEHMAGKSVCLLAIGVQAVNQAVKAIAVANGRGAAHGRVLTALPALESITISNDQGESVERTLVKLVLVPYTW